MRHYILLFILFIIFPSASSAWWNKDWVYKKKIDLNSQSITQAGLAIPDDAYALIRLHTGNFSHFLDLADNANDIRIFSGDEQTPLKFFIEKFDQINEMALIWVKLPKGLANTPEPAIWIYYGNPAATDGQDAPGSFDVSQILTYPFGKTGIKDYTANNNNPNETNVTFTEGGVIAEAAVFDAKQSIHIPASPSLQIQPQQGWTFTVWLKGDQSGALDGTVLQLSPAKPGLAIVIKDKTPTVEFANAGNQQVLSASSPLDPTTWHHLALVATASNLSLYIDGKPAGHQDVALADLSGDLVVGNDGAGSKGFVGMMDHLAMYKIARDANALAFDVLMQGPNSTLLTYGNDASGDEEEAGESRIMSTLNDVTVDGWVIIGLLAVMFVISWIIMVIKAFKLAQNHNKNRQFEVAFTKLKANEIEALDEGDNDDQSSPILLSMTGEHRRFLGSSIYNLYHMGVEEINRRLVKAVGADVSNQAISDKGINSVRAAMDSVLVREIQKLNSQMVLLTIAISGGPFLGLLGTVLGVMITFSDIAASGEINVNAIAPGIAAALVATVAGLLVAIPALFGYSYLASRIKVITADMHIFVDEFTAKLSERYGD